MSGSLFSLLVSQHAKQLVPMRCRAPLLARLARHFEDLVVENDLYALVVQGRCLDGVADVERQRFFRLSAAARQHYVFACGPNCPSRTWSVPTFPNAVTFEQRDFHEFDTGPFILIVDPHYSGVLASHRLAGEDADGASYEMVWSFEPNVVFTALEYLHARVSAQHREDETQFARHLRESAPLTSSLRLTLNLTTKLARLLQRQTEIETAINRIAGMVASTFDLESLYQGVVDLVASSLGVRRAALSVWRENSHVPEAVCEAVRPAREAAAADDGRPAMAPIEVPIVLRGTATGLLTVEDDSPVRVWEEEEVMMVRTIADHLAVGIGNARLFKRVEEQAITDDLTGLYNRRHLDERLEREVQMARRNGDQVSLVLLDLDHLKRINDTFGHPVGDAVLRHVGATLREVVRTVDVCARYGGEEFAVILPYTDLEEALLTAERIRAALSDMPLPPVGRVTASLGVATFPEIASDVASLVEEADRALYAAKRAGRNRVARPVSEVGDQESGVGERARASVP
jgi:diguanylate cyclase (GGDEF)-like protein